MLIGGMNHPARPLPEQIQWLGTSGFRFLDLRLAVFFLGFLFLCFRVADGRRHADGRRKRRPYRRPDMRRDAGERFEPRGLQDLGETTWRLRRFGSERQRFERARQRFPVLRTDAAQPARFADGFR